MGNGIKLELVKVPAGSFIMGSQRHPDEMPQTITKIDKPFWIGRFEITNEQYRAFNPQHDSRDEHRHGYQFGRRGYSMNGDNQPAVRISWKEAMEYCQWLSEKTGMKFTLPTEAQWEWACRSGSNTAFWFGDLKSDFSSYANLGDIKLKEFAACTAYKFYESAEIIQNPNKYDDWIPSVYQPYPYQENDGRNDPQAGKGKRVVRGGSWYDRPYRATSSFRLPYRDYQKVYNVGFRVVMEED